MKFYAEPNHTVMCGKTKKVLFKFNEQGEYSTDDNEIVLRLKPHFKFDEELPVKPIKRARKTK